MSTYLELVNNILNRLNEVELDSSTFASARGVHNAAKIGVKNAVNMINAQKWEWPFNYAATTQLLTVGQELYSFPADYKIADWESFYFAKQTVSSLEYPSSRLVPIQRQEWFKRYRQRDVDSETDGIEIPKMVFWYGNGQFGVTPSPSVALTVSYTYWKLTDELVDYDDEITVPENFNWVVELGALEQMYMFLDNDQRAGLAGLSFKDAIMQMASILVPWNISDMRDPRVNFGAGYFNTRYLDYYS